MKTTQLPTALVTSLSALALVAGAVGCANERATDGYSEAEYAAPDDEESPWTSDERDMAFDHELGSLPVRDAALFGTVGPVQVNEESAWSDGYREPGYAGIYTVVEEGEGGAGMSIVELTGGVEHPAWAPGESYTYDADDYFELEGGEAFVNVIGCSGKEAGSWDWDETADTVWIDVYEGPEADTVRLEYSAQFEDYTGQKSVVGGGFVIDTVPSE